nr:hypothetical protein [Tanacetum cinerariifolium]
MCDLFDENNLFIFDDESVRISPVSKMPFRKKPRDSMNMRSKSNMNKSLPRTMHRWLPKMKPLAEPVAKWIPRHMTGNRALLTNSVEKFLGTVRFGNNDFAMIAGYEDVVIGSMTIKKVYYVEGLGHNLFSVGQFCDKGLEVAFRKSTCFVRNEDGVDLLTSDRSSNLYTIALNEVTSNSSACLPKMKFEKDHLCSACEQGKIYQKHYKSKTAFALNKPLYLLHMDLYGPMHVESTNGKRYVLVVLDDYSRYTWRVRTNNGTEFKNKTLAKLFDEVGITQHFSAAEAIATACFTQNRSIIHKRFDKTPYELMNKRKPNIKFFCVFRCRFYLLNDYEDVGKLKEKGDIGVFVRYSKESAAFRIYNKQTRKIHESVNVNFDEISKMIMKSSTTTVETSNVEIPSHEEEVFHESSESFQDESSSSSLNDDVQQSLEEVILPQTNTQLISNNMVPNVDKASTSHNVLFERLEDAYFAATEALRDVDWVSAMQEELDQFTRLKVWRLVPRPEGKTIIKTKWIFKNKKDESNLVIRNKASLVVVGYSQQEYIDYDEMFALVARIEAIRLFLEYAAHKDFTVFQMDVNIAFLNGILIEEVYVGQPPSFISKQYPDYVYALDKALYGLKQAPQAWYDVLSQFLIGSGFQK